MSELPSFLRHLPYRIASRRELTADIIELVIEPVDEAIMPPKAGQWAFLELLNPDGLLWARAAYSFANAGCEIAESNRIELAIKRSKEFTARVFTLKEGEIVNLQGPFGVFVMEPNTPQSVFFAGGIGITPLRSMIREILLCKIEGDISLFFSCRKREEIPYLEEFHQLAVEHENFHFFPICTREEEESSWEGLRGRLTSDMLDQQIQRVEDAAYYICGPNEFIDGMTNMLKQKNVPAKKIHMERFG